MGRMSGGLGHGIGRGEADRIGGLDRSGGRKAGELGDAAAGAPRRKIPQRAVYGIAGGAGRHGGAQAFPVEARGDRAGHRLDRVENLRHRFAIAGIGHGLAAPGGGAVADPGDDDRGLGLGAAGNRETARNRPCLGGNSQRLYHREKGVLPCRGCASRAHSRATIRRVGNGLKPPRRAGKRWIRRPFRTRHGWKRRPLAV